MSAEIATLRKQLREEELKLISAQAQNDKQKAAKATKNSTTTTAIEQRFSPEELADLQHAFDEIDIDRSGTISMSELISISKRLGVEMTEKKAKAEMEALDTNKDGVLSFAEFVAWWGESAAGGSRSAGALLAIKSKLKARHLLSKLTRSLNITPDATEEGMKMGITANIGGGGSSAAKSNTSFQASVIPTDADTFYASMEAKGAPLFKTKEAGSDSDSSSYASDDSSSYASDDSTDSDVDPNDKKEASAVKKLAAKRAKAGIRAAVEVKCTLSTAGAKLSKDTLQEECTILNGVIDSLLEKAKSFVSVAAKPSDDGTYIHLTGYFYGEGHDKIGGIMAKANKKSGGSIPNSEAILREASLSVEFNSDITDSLKLQNGAPLAKILDGVTVSGLANLGPVLTTALGAIPHLRGRHPILAALQQADIKMNYSNVDELKARILKYVEKLPHSCLGSDEDDVDVEEDQKAIRQIKEVLGGRMELLSQITIGEILCELFPRFRQASKASKPTAEHIRAWQNWKEPDQSKWAPLKGEIDDSDEDASDDEGVEVSVAKAFDHFLTLLEGVDEVSVQHVDFILNLSGKNLNVFNAVRTTTSRADAFRENKLSLRLKTAKLFSSDESNHEGASQMLKTIPPKGLRGFRHMGYSECIDLRIE